MSVQAAAATAAVIIGPGQHGVVLLARRLAAADASTRVINEPDVAGFEARHDLSRMLGDVQSIHVHFTDQLFGGTANRARRVSHDC